MSGGTIAISTSTVDSNIARAPAVAQEETGAQAAEE